MDSEGQPIAPSLIQIENKRFLGEINDEVLLQSKELLDPSQ